MWKHLLSAYLDFSKKERRGITILCVVILLLAILPYLFPLFIKPPVVDYKVFEAEIASLEEADADSTERFDSKSYQRNDSKSYKTSFEKAEVVNLSGELFQFDPNTATEAEWSRLGLRTKIIATIIKYRSKGGRFYKPGDLKKIWGLHPDLAQRLVPFVQIGHSNADNVLLPPARKPEKPGLRGVDINLADTTAFIALPGIGSKLSQRIILFRTKLGGFYSVDQVAETFGLPDSTFQKIKPRLQLGVQPVNQLNVNTATLEELKAHPYLRYAVANAIVQYRTQHGSFSTVDDLENVMIFSAPQLSKAAPYLRTN
ncbi:MAG: helix-hairpin-helix domain-containing protein [Bacteroidota bacterium]